MTENPVITCAIRSGDSFICHYIFLYSIPVIQVIAIRTSNIM
jgi:hypothetical protein